MTYSILVIEDNPDVMHVVQHELENAGFIAHTADTGAGGLSQARELNPDLVILDLGLPDFDGAEVARQLRRSTNVPIIILTALDAIERKVELFGFGANDYITKPFNTADLIARVNAQLHQANINDLLAIGELCVTLPARQATYAGQNLALEDREFDLLTLLVRQPGRIFTPEQLLETLWEGQVDQKANLDACLESLRGKLRGAGAQDVIRTVRGMGYAFRPPVQENALATIQPR
ncbi:response regulator transcription factor [Deinococcus peraridilitoris]|uniref:Response regulator with CheY-like receiver domain and winged-helix DNA-binding domain protein n=1 Tax=Deinococcus peraridilitoris (strain DSM 19664 / LMG 22246 / CIP 109416 / KR-200) TaxID=937777 RepID=L0A1G0_DEIPD|nr:response regulator transcription factor [Deinococcus peraridilitoris]AFZ67289.1 response regulator with CheY-like receiver domain and winged-helix DNA-binding domain protein [Deinococcus peraridilitoris DSM 19664]